MAISSLCLQRWLNKYRNMDKSEASGLTWCRSAFVFSADKGIADDKHLSSML